MNGELSEQLKEWGNHNKSDLREGMEFSADAVKWLLDIAVKLSELVKSLQVATVSKNFELSKLNNEIARRDELLLKAIRYMRQNGLDGQYGCVLLYKQYRLLTGKKVKE